jgi:hypothetical protein
MEITASRLSDGNKLFPARITLTVHGVTLKVPGFLGGSEQTIPFDRISSVDIETPFVGFSTIKIYSVGWDVIVASGFAKADVKAMKDGILNGQKNKNNPPKHDTSPVAQHIPQVVNETKENVSPSKKIKWSEELREMKELLEDDVISADDFEEQKLKLMSNINLDGDIKLTDALRELKSLQEDEIISESELQILKQNLMNK